MGAELLLGTELPCVVNLGGEEWKINYGFKTGIRLDLMYHDQSRTREERFTEMLKIFYGGIPYHLEDAINNMLWFYTRGEYTPQSEEQGPSDRQPKKTPREFCFKQDADLILSAFLSEYGLWLNRMNDEDMHWWEFMGLFSGLPEETTIKKYIYYRTVNLGGLSKSEQKNIKAIRAKIKVNDHVKHSDMTPAQRLAKRNEEWLRIASRG